MRMADRFDFDVNGNRRLAIIRSSPAPAEDSGVLISG